MASYFVTHIYAVDLPEKGTPEYAGLIELMLERYDTPYVAKELEEFMADSDAHLARFIVENMHEGKAVEANTIAGGYALCQNVDTQVIPRGGEE
jgi:hypothetical protein